MIVKPPTPLPSRAEALATGRKCVFLAGSIEMGAAENWQDRAGRVLDALGAVVLNPRRDDWEPSWEQAVRNDKFREQVEWEMDGLDLADRVLMHFDPATKSPISLLELGYLATSGRLVVSCPHGFWRRGNVEVVCLRHAIPLYDNLWDALASVEADSRKWREENQ